MIHDEIWWGRVPGVIDAYGHLLRQTPFIKQSSLFPGELNICPVEFLVAPLPVPLARSGGCPFLHERPSAQSALPAPAARQAPVPVTRQVPILEDPF
jgi:hypothetical protein